ncbi:hypothetical protein CLOM_g692 [Closterium sp. NIES-68]|nr:hypothetical protein CLOM_g692 [Closterium sp. NIES-68]
MSALEKNATTEAGLRQASRVAGISWSASVGCPRVAGGGTRLGPAADTAVPRSGTKSNTKTPDFRRARPMKRPPFPCVKLGAEVHLRNSSVGSKK